ncbi:DNA methyltransferase [Candidatus Marifrigoribacter sp. Uisw_064]|uniref:Eco57I restriction-modification methylase domain-containing protein n=1 Tax=Candidatus Marifrigoribacter sp. Uisw_064 TaxID=3230970 RepID=UPI003D516355
MPLYQNSVLKKYLKQQDSEAVSKAFKKFAKYFHDPKIQENIRSSKEEEYQGIFLTELFSKILGYTMKPNANFNLVAEYKNEKNSRKADGAILKDNEALGVIELKGTNTKDLEKVRQQAFDYKANQTGCVYVITSNFEKIRFYINNAVDFEEFDLFTINQERFELLYLCLAQENLLNNVPLKIKEASVQEEEAITKQFYKDYSTFKRELFRDLVKLNMKNEVFRAELNIEDAERANKNIKHNLFKKSQKLIDRFLFIFFAEDRGLLPPNSTVKILEQWDKLKELDEVVPLYSRYKKYFNYLDTGRKGTDKTAEIFAYNGGLFKPDPVLDSLIISDELLAKHTNALQAYDFESQVDVNILGHIFENSLNEIESVNAEIEGGDFDKQTSKRKKDGVFYTPKYITKYIVDNTVGKLCTEKKTELGVIEEEYFKSRKGRTKAKLKELMDNSEAYRDWLLQITILDPACGSGAFLNQALDFLIKEHQYISELQTNLLGGGFVFPDIENTVLENNIFGVDLNEESVEIAKLSLWLRTAQPRRKLNNLSSNIKCGNSLIDSKSVAGDKAFKWEEEFKEIFAKGGFDVVIGNPPYVRVQELEHEEIDWYKKNKITAFKRVDISIIFFEQAEKILKDGGILAFITSNQFQNAEYGKNIRKFIVEKLTIQKIIDFGDLPIFDDALTYVSIYNLSKGLPKDFLYKKINNIEVAKTGDYNSFIEIEIKSIDDSTWQLVSKNESNLLNKLSNFKTLGEIGNAWAGLFTGLDELLMFNPDEITSLPIEKELLLPIIRAADPIKYGKASPSKYVLYPYKEVGDKTVVLSEEELINEYPNAFAYLNQHKERLQQRKDSRKTFADRKDWYALTRFGRKTIFNRPKIVSPGEVKGHKFSIDTTGSGFSCARVFAITAENNYPLTGLMALLNSSLIKFFLQRLAPVKAGGYFSYSSNVLNQVPIIATIPIEFLDKIDVIISLNEKFETINNSYIKYLTSQFCEIVLQKKLQKWYELEFGEFIKELNKAIKKVGGEKLTKTDEMEWMDVFETKKAEAQTLKVEIDKTDAEIDQMVYELYKLTDKEIQIVENN